MVNNKLDIIHFLSITSASHKLLTGSADLQPSVQHSSSSIHWHLLQSMDLWNKFDTFKSKWNAQRNVLIDLYILSVKCNTMTIKLLKTTWWTLKTALWSISDFLPFFPFSACFVLVFDLFLIKAESLEIFSRYLSFPFLFSISMHLKV